MCNKMFRIYLRIGFLYLLILLNVSDMISGLKDVSVTVPAAVRRGDSALLICNYDMENDTLYSVKWYKGRREFYRYTPKENPAMKTFPSPGITVERNFSNQTHLFLSSLQLNLSGKFTCEISADAPEFHTNIATAYMAVVEIPEQRPIITSIHSRYRLGDVVNGNCSSDFSKPAANLTWTINDIPVLPSQARSYPIQKNPNDLLETSVVEINFIVSHLHFIRGRFKLKCSAKIFKIYEQESEKIIEEDRPRILASGRSPDMNLFPFDQQTDTDFPDQNEFYSTLYKETASAAGMAVKHHNNKCDLLTIINAKIANKTSKFGKFIIILLNVLSFYNLYVTIIISMVFAKSLIKILSFLKNMIMVANFTETVPILDILSPQSVGEHTTENFIQFS